MMNPLKGEFIKCTWKFRTKASLGRLSSKLISFFIEKNVLFYLDTFHRKNVNLMTKFLQKLKQNFYSNDESWKS